MIGLNMMYRHLLYLQPLKIAITAQRLPLQLKDFLSHQLAQSFFGLIQAVSQLPRKFLLCLIDLTYNLKIHYHLYFGYLWSYYLRFEQLYL